MCRPGLPIWMFGSSPGMPRCFSMASPWLWRTGKGLVPWRPGRFLLQARRTRKTRADGRPGSRPGQHGGGRDRPGDSLRFLPNHQRSGVFGGGSPRCERQSDWPRRDPIRQRCLPSGEYRARVRKDGTTWRKSTRCRPGTAAAILVKLTPMEKMTEGVALMAFMRRTMEKQVDLSGIDDPKTTLLEALDQLAKSTASLLTLMNDRSSLRVSMMFSRPKLPTRTRSRRCTASFRTVLKNILARISVPSGATVVPRKAAPAVCSVSRREGAANTLITVLHPIGDLTTGPEASSPQQLLDAHSGVHRLRQVPAPNHKPPRWRFRPP